MSFTKAHANIRRAQVKDADAIAAVHVAAWQESYTGLVPEEMLASLSVAEWAEDWRHILVEPDPIIATAVFVACTPGGAVAGFSSCGRQRSAELAGAGFDGEFQAIYVLRAAQRRGVGRALMGVMARHLADHGFQGGALWVLIGNQPAQDFYGMLGGVSVAQREDKGSQGIVFFEIAYGWTNLASLATAAS